MMGEFPGELFDDHFYACWTLVDRYAERWAVKLAADLGLEEPLSETRSVDELLGAIGAVPEFAGPLRWLLETLVNLGLVERAEAEDRRYRLRKPLSDPGLDRVAEACRAADPANAATLALLDAAGTAYPKVARGETTGQEALFGLGQTKLWLDYFSNENPTYRINNDLGSIAATNRLRAGSGIAVLEVGGGAGSGTEELLERLRSSGRLEDLDRYLFTEPSPFFRRRAERKLRSRFPEVPLESAAVDLDLDLEDQGIRAESFDLLYAVNVIHVAKDLDHTLSQLRRTLKPSGWLVATEAIRPLPDEPISTELVFQLLESFREVETDELRPNPGFLTPEQWRSLFRRAGYSSVEVLPDHERITPLYSKFYTGVICARP